MFVVVFNFRDENLPTIFCLVQQPVKKKAQANTMGLANYNPQKYANLVLTTVKNSVVVLWMELLNYIS
jgi:hypothetical protein